MGIRLGIRTRSKYMHTTILWALDGHCSTPGAGTTTQKACEKSQAFFVFQRLLQEADRICPILGVLGCTAARRRYVSATGHQWWPVRQTVIACILRNPAATGAAAVWLCGVFECILVVTLSGGSRCLRA